MRLRHRLLSGVVLLVSLVSSQPTMAELIEQKIGDMGRTTLLTLHVFTEGGPQGGLSFSCEEERGDIQIFMRMPSYRLKNTNDGPCHQAAVTWRFDAHPEIRGLWHRPKGLNTYMTFVTTHPRRDSFCWLGLRLPVSTSLMVDHAISAKYLQAIISDIDLTSEGPNQFTDSPLLRFHLEPVRSDLIELQNRCRKKK